MKKTRRKNVKHPSFHPEFNHKVKNEYLDQDYINGLSEEEKDFLDKFNQEYYGATLDYQNLENNLHNTPELKKRCTDRNNAQNRCTYGLGRAKKLISNTLFYPEDIEKCIDNQESELESENIEDLMIEYLDSKKE